MAQGYKMLGFVVIAILYIAIGIMAAMGTICIFRKIFTPKAEQILLCSVPDLNCRFLPGFCRLLRSVGGVAIGNHCGSNICQR